MNKQGKLLLQGMAVGGGAALLVWLGLRTAIDRQFDKQAEDLLSELKPKLRREIKDKLDEEVPPQVRREMEATLRDFGLTPETGRRIDRILSAADDIGLLGLRAGAGAQA